MQTKNDAGQVSEINLWRKNLTRLPAEVFGHPLLEVLNLSENRLASIPDVVGHLAHLRTLDLGHNQLSSLPESLGQLVNLSDYLYLHDNRLTWLRESLFAAMTRLASFNFSNNRLPQLPHPI